MEAQSQEQFIYTYLHMYFRLKLILDKLIGLQDRVMVNRAGFREGMFTDQCGVLTVK